MHVALPSRRPALRKLCVVAAGLALAAPLAACGGGDDAASPTSGAPAGNAALGPAKAATGAPVLVGFVATGRTAAVDTTDEIKGAQAVVKYANAYLGGIGGRPIELVTCEEKSVPATAQDCANQFVAKKILVLDAGSPGQIGAVIKGITPAGIPTFVNAGSDTVTLGTDNVFVEGNPLSSFGTTAAFARQEGNKKATVLVIDVPSASGPAKQLEPIFFRNAGATADVVAIPPGTADMTAQVQAAISKGTDQFHLIGDPSFCTSALKAIKNLAFKGDVTMLDRCVDATGAASIPGGYEGVTITGQANFSKDDAEYKLYAAVLANADLKESSNASSGYQGMLGLVRALNGANVTDFTTTGFAAAIKAMPVTPIPLGGGATFKCDGTAIAGVSKNICATFGTAGTADKAGAVSEYETLDTAGIYKLG